MSKINRLLWRYITSSPTKFHFPISNSFIENRWTDKQTNRKTNMTDYPIVAEGAYKNQVTWELSMFWPTLEPKEPGFPEGQ